MLSVKGIFQDGVAQPTEPVEGLDGRQVIITFLDEAVNSAVETEDIIEVSD